MTGTEIIYDEAGIRVYRYFDGQQLRLNIDIGGVYDKDALKELKRKARSLRIKK